MQKTIVLGITGSVAAYKSIDLAKKLIEYGYDLKIVMSQGASQFITKSLLQALFPKKVYDFDDDYSSDDEMLHIKLAKLADLVLICPASANFIAQLAQGAASCLLSTICLATKSKIMIAPAMNCEMWSNQIVAENIGKLKDHGFQVVEPILGKQACGDYGIGNLAPITIIEEAVNKALKKQLLANQKIIITAGPTVEKIDPVRFISNFSSGKMGVAIAKAAAEMGADVTLVCGPIKVTPPTSIKVVEVESAEQMLKQCLRVCKDSTIFIGAAAVADYRVESPSSVKLKKQSKNLNLVLVENPDIIRAVKIENPSIYSVGFAAETNNHVEYATAKMIAKNMDMIALNAVEDQKVFGSDSNTLKVYRKDGKEWDIPETSKYLAALKLLEIIAESLVK